MSKPALPKYKQQGDVPFILTARDIEILQAINRYRYLRTGQIQRLIFPDCTTVQSPRRRLKYLFHNQYLGRMTPYVQIGHGSSEVAYYLDKNGRRYLEEIGETLTTYAKGGQVRPQFLHHALDLSEFRVHLELALQSHSIVELKRFVADFELKGKTKDAVGKKRYRLYDEVEHPVHRQSYVVYPDALIILQGKDDYAHFQKLYFLEIDRGTESHTVLRNKIIGYNLYRNLKIFQKFGKFDRFQVLIQTSSPKRMENLQKAFTDLEGADLVWLTDHTQVTAESILSKPVWQDAKGDYHPIVKQD